MNILLFGGSFNPPHLGHQIVIEQAFELLPQMDELWLLPTYNHQFGKTSIDSQHRLKMCQTLTSQRVKLFPLEIDYQSGGSTYETLQLLKSEKEYINKTMFPQSPITNHQSLNFSFLMGSDQLPTFQKWENWEKLLEEMHFYIYPRGSHRHPVEFANMTLLESPTQVITNISSTIIRHRLHESLPIDRIVPSAIKEYIEGHKLYSSF